METDEQYFDCLCRTCMNKVEASSRGGTTKPQQQWLSIFDITEECGALRIAELLSDAVPQIVVQPNDELSKKICSECLQRLLNVYRFQQMCVRSDTQMHELLSNKRTVLKTPVLEESIKRETERSGAESEPLEDCAYSSTLQQPSIQEPPSEVTVQTIEPEAAQSSAADNLQDNTQLLERCNDSQGEFAEFVKNEPIEDDEANSEHSDGDTIHSTISITKDELIEPEDQQVNDALSQHNCHLCNKFYKSTESLKRHLLYHKKKANFSKGCYFACHLCNKSYQKQQYLSKHLNLAHSLEPQLTCDFCNERFASSSELRQHIRTHTAERPNVSPECGKSFQAQSILGDQQQQQKQRTTHTADKPYECPYCPLRFNFISGVWAHKRIHEGIKRHKCNICGKKFRQKSDLMRHKLIHSTEKPNKCDLCEKQTYAGDKPYECPYCPLRFRSKTLVSNHKVVHEGAAKLHECDICGKKFRKKSDLTKHKRIHSNEKPHKCDFCEKRFVRSQHLKIHIRTHTGEKPYKCKYCERDFASLSQLTCHLHTHLGKNVYRCQFCPLAVPSYAELRVHLTSHKNEDPETRDRNLKALQEDEAKLVLKFSAEKWKGQATEEQQQQKLSNKEIEQPSTDILAVQRTTDADKPYECSYCPRRFSLKGNASKHQKIHEGAAKRHECDICLKKFRLSGDLKQHKRIHSNEKPYKCDLCEKRYAYIPQLRVHIRKHTGEKPYKCKYCERGFVGHTPLNNHLRSHLGENIHRCKFCPLAFPLKSEMRLHLSSHKNEDPDVREQNLKALQEDEAKLVLKFSKAKSGGQSTQEQQQQEEIEQPSTEFPHMAQLKDHIRTHTGERPYKCKYCERGFGSPNILRSHLRIHLGKNIHLCKFCPLAFPSSVKMRLHLSSHKNEDPDVREQNLKALQEDEAKLVLKFSKAKSGGQSTQEQQQQEEIEQPSTEFPHMAQLKDHIRTHTGERPYKCKYCERGFGSPNILHSHLRIHLGKNIHLCKFCPLAFPSSVKMRLHLTSHKNEDPEVREQNLKALQEKEAKLVLKFSKKNSGGQSTKEQHQQKLSNKEIEHPSTERDDFEEFIKNEPIEDDKCSREYGDGDTMHSRMSVIKDKALSIETADRKVNETRSEFEKFIKNWSPTDNSFFSLADADSD